MRIGWVVGHAPRPKQRWASNEPNDEGGHRFPYNQRIVYRPCQGRRAEQGNGCCLLHHSNMQLITVPLSSLEGKPSVNEAKEINQHVHSKSRW
eukprot:854805-Pelagomonas_calceolata.AAC.1